MMEEKILDLEGCFGNAKLSPRNLSQFLVDEHFAGKTEHGTCDGLEMKKRMKAHLLFNRFQGVKDVTRIGGVQRGDDAYDLLAVLLGTQHHGVDRQLETNLEGKRSAARQILRVTVGIRGYVQCMQMLRSSSRKRREQKGLAVVRNNDGEHGQ